MNEGDNERPIDVEFEVRNLEGEEISTDYEYVEGGKPKKDDPLRIHVMLFVITIFTTMLAGAILEGVNIIDNPLGIIEGIPFSFSILFILGTHEFGHYFAARYNKVKATLPYFIPAPPIPIGTFGAIIKMKSPILTKRALVDIGASGPIAGFIAAIGVTYVGLQQSEIVRLYQYDLPFILGDSFIYLFLKWVSFGTIPDGYIVEPSSIAFAGWIGFFITCLNLLPIGQLDGGHVMYAVSPKIHGFLSAFMVLVLAVCGFYGWSGWLLWAFLVF